MNKNDIFIKHTNNHFIDENNVINIKFSDSNQSGGGIVRDNIYNMNDLSITSSEFKNKLTQNGGFSETSEYFNRLAEKIVNKTKELPSNFNNTGGFIVDTKIDDSSDIFLSSDTIRDIKATSITGGAKKYNNTFDFNSLKNHLRKVVELSDTMSEQSAGSKSSENGESSDIIKIDEDDDNDDDKLFEDDDDDDNPIIDSDSETDDEIIKDIKKSNSNEFSEEVIVKKVPNVNRQNNSKQIQNNSKYKSSESSESSKSSESSGSSESSKLSKSSESLSLHLDNSDSSYSLSHSISSPKLMSYRKIKNNNNSTGRRFL